MNSRGSTAGFGLLDAMIGVVVMTIFVGALEAYVSNVVQVNSVMEERQDYELARQYIEHNFDCDKTFKKLAAANCGIPGTYIEAYAKDGSLLAKADQTGRLPLHATGNGLMGIRVRCVDADQLFVEVRQYSGISDTTPTKNYLDFSDKPNAGWVDPFHGIPPAARQGVTRPPLDFEAIPGAHEGMSIESGIVAGHPKMTVNDYFKATSGVWFSSGQGGSLQLVKVVAEGDPEPAVSAWLSIMCAKKPNHNRLCNGGDVNPDGSLNKWLMSTTSAVSTRDVSLTIHYLVPVKDLSISIADIDGCETYDFLAKDEAGRQLSIVTSPSPVRDCGYGAGTGNNRLTPVTVKANNGYISTLALHGQKSIKAYGFGFDNFATGIPTCVAW